MDHLRGHQAGHLKAEHVHIVGELRGFQRSQYLAQARLRQASGQEQDVLTHCSRSSMRELKSCTENTTLVSRNAESRSTFSRSMGRGYTQTCRSGASVM